MKINKYSILLKVGLLLVVARAETIIEFPADTLVISSDQNSVDDVMVIGTGPGTGGTGTPNPNRFLYGYSVSNNATLNNIHNINLNGAYNLGVLLENNSNFSNSGKIYTNNTNGLGILSADGRGQIINEVGGEIHVNQGGQGIATRGFSGTSFTGLIHNKGLIKSLEGGSAIFAYGSQHSVGGTIINDGVIDLGAGTYARGISVSGFSTVYNNGSISGSSSTTVSSSAALIDASAGAQIFNSATGTIIGKNNSTGIYAANSSNSVNKTRIVNNGIIQVEKGTGIYSLGSEIINNGTIISDNIGVSVDKFANAGYPASSLVNDGTIRVSNNSTAIRAGQATVTNNGLIDITGSNSRGIFLFSGSEYDGRFINRADITAADNLTSVTLIELSGSSGGLTNAYLDNNAQLTALGNGSIAIYSKSNAKITNTGDITVKNGTGIRLEDASLLEGDNQGKILVTGSGTGILASASSARGSTVIHDGEITLLGNGTGIYVESRSAFATGSNGENKGSIIFRGSGGTGVYVTDAKSTFTNKAPLISDQSATTGLVVTNAAHLLNQSDITLTGNNSIGISVGNTGNLDEQSGIIHVTHGTGIQVTGAGSILNRSGTLIVDDGVAGIRLQNGARAVMTDNSQITIGGSAHGILLDTLAAGLTLGNRTLDILGDGHGIENKAEVSDILLDQTRINVTNGAGIRTATSLNQNSTVTINVAGTGTGFGFKQSNGTLTNRDLILGSGYDITVTGTQGIGIEALTTGEVTTAATVQIMHNTGGPAALMGTARKSTNLGHLASISNNAAVVDLSNGTGTEFTNTGSILAGSASHSAVLGSSGNDILTFSAGTVRGEIDSGTGNDAILFNGGTLEGGISLKGTQSALHIQNVDLSTTYHAQATPGNNMLTLDQITTKGGSFSQDDPAKGINLNSGWSTINLSNGTEFTLTDNLQLTGSSVNIDATSTLMAGNGVQPIIYSGHPDSLKIMNQGMIDLTNGGQVNNTLTIKGHYEALDGRIKLNTVLNSGGALSNQVTDRLLIERDVSGTTAIMVVVGGTGDITDMNRDGIIQANEGISLIQVAGNSTANAFVLNAPVHSGAYTYGLYSFAPGLADPSQRLVAGSGNMFWDYRLANEFVCPPGESCDVQPIPVDPSNPGTSGMGYLMPENGRYRLTPQMQAYISLPSAIADYNNVVTDDLHKRLGEIRHDQISEHSGNGEFFVRYMGAQSKYKSNVSFKNYGFDYDLDINAMQIGANLFTLSRGGHDLFRGGVAYTRGQSTLKPKSSDGYSKTRIDSDTLAVYLTWLQKNGLYVDGVLAYNHHKSNVETRQFYKRDQNMRAKGWLASIETGYPIKLSNDFIVEPQGQVTYQSVNVKNFRDINGANLRYDTYHQTTLRLGVRASRTWTTERGNQHTPYVRMNYYRHFGGGAKLKVMPDSYTFLNNGDLFTGGKRGHAVQIGAGISSKFKRQNLSVFGEVDYQKNLGSFGSKGLRLNVGAKWVF